MYHILFIFILDEYALFTKMQMRTLNFEIVKVTFLNAYSDWLKSEIAMGRIIRVFIQAVLRKPVV